MRPDSIRKFDLFYLGSIVVSLLISVLAYGAIMEQAEAQAAESGIAVGSGLVIGSIAVGTLISLLLWYLVSRKGFVIAKWVVVLFFAYSLVKLPSLFAGGLGAVEALSLLGVIFQAAAVWYLFQPDAKAWFAGNRETAPADPAD
ncbi:hypothetical protein [Tsuneonella sp. HG222]